MGFQRIIGPAGYAYYIQLLTDGTVLMVTDQSATYIITPDESGSFDNPTFKRVADVPKTALYGPVTIANDGKMIQHIGEAGSSAGVGGWWTCVYDPKTETWTSQADIRTTTPSGGVGWTNSVAFHSSTHMADDGRLLSWSNSMAPGSVLNTNTISVSPYMTAPDIDNGASIDIGECGFVHLPDGNAVVFRSTPTGTGNYEALVYNPNYDTSFVSNGSIVPGKSVIRIPFTPKLNALWNSLPTSQRWIGTGAEVGGFSTPLRLTSPGPAIPYEIGATVWSPKLNKIVIFSGTGVIFTCDKPVITGTGQNQTADISNLAVAAIMPLGHMSNPGLGAPKLLGKIKATNNGQTPQAIANTGTFVIRFTASPNQSSSQPGPIVDTLVQYPQRNTIGFFSNNGSSVKSVYIKMKNNTTWARMDFSGVSHDGVDITFTGCSIGASAGDYLGTLATDDEVVLGRPQYTCMDAPATFLPNGDIVFCAGLEYFYASAGYFNSSSSLFKFDGTTITRLGSSDLTDVVSHAIGQPEWSTQLTSLPNGQILWTNQNQHRIYTPTSEELTPFAGSRPTITSIPSKILAGEPFSITGTQVNGLHEGGSFGDDKTFRSNHPIVRFTSQTTGKVYFGRTRDFTYRGIRPNRISTFNVETKYDTIPPGRYNVDVIASGVPTATPTEVVIAPSSAGESIFLEYAGPYTP